MLLHPKKRTIHIPLHSEPSKKCFSNKVSPANLPGESAARRPRLAEVAVFLHRSAHGGHLAEVGHQGRPVSSAEGTAVDSGTAGVGREGEVGGDPEIFDDFGMEEP